jgi:hypothetical protein
MSAARRSGRSRGSVTSSTSKPTRPSLSLPSPHVPSEMTLVLADERDEHLGTVSMFESVREIRFD